MNEYLTKLLSMAVAQKKMVDWGDYFHINLADMLKLAKITSEESGNKSLYSLARRSMDFFNKKDYSSLKSMLALLILECSKMLELKEVLTGYSYQTMTDSSVKKQARLVSEYIAGITVKQAENMLTIAFNANLDVVIGGSSLRKNQLGNDLDVGFKIHNNSFAQEQLPFIVSAVVNKINKKCFSSFLKKGGLVRHKWLHDKSQLRGIPDIDTVEEFFLRQGIRYEPKVVEKDGVPFGPSGYILLKKTGEVLLVLPKYAQKVVGSPKFW